MRIEVVSRKQRLGLERRRKVNALRRMQLESPFVGRQRKGCRLQAADPPAEQRSQQPVCKLAAKTEEKQMVAAARGFADLRQHPSAVGNAGNTRLQREMSLRARNVRTQTREIRICRLELRAYLAEHLGRGGREWLR